jgi:hypothetical protein
VTDDGDGPDIFGFEPEKCLVVRPSFEALTGVLQNERCATCGEVKVISATPIQALCGALMGSGVPDSPMQVRDHVGVPVMLIASIHAAALAGSRPA